MTDSALVAFAVVPLAVLTFGLSLYVPSRHAKTHQG